ncbi:MAG: nucleotidyltransferase domain-containing protein [Stellaceae bacterium]
MLAALNDHDAEVWLFGSCAHDEVMQHSDIDIAILPHGELPSAFFALLEADIEDSSIPCRFAPRRIRAARRGTPRRHQVERLDRRLAEAKAGLATLDEAIDRVPRSLFERDSAILRLI